MRFHLSIGFFSIIASALGDDAQVKALPTPPPRELIQNESYIQFRREVNELLDTIYRNKPEIFGDLKRQQQREKILSEITTAATPDIQYYGRFSNLPKQTSGIHAEKAAITVYKPIKIPGSEVYYCRIDTLKPKNIMDAVKDKSCPMVIDLRNCSGGDWESAKMLMDKISGQCILLIGPNTSGPAEAVAAVAIKSAGITMGEKTAGKPFEEERIKLANGTILIFPKQPKAFAAVPFKAVTPVIPKKSSPVVDYIKLEKNQDTGRDQCLIQAAELIKVMNIIKAPGKK